MNKVKQILDEAKRLLEGNSINMMPFDKSARSAYSGATPFEDDEDDEGDASEEDLAPKISVNPIKVIRDDGKTVEADVIWDATGVGVSLLDDEGGEFRHDADDYSEGEGLIDYLSQNMSLSVKKLKSMNFAPY